MATSKRQKVESDSDKISIESSPYYEYLTRMLESVSNKKWDDMEFYLNNMRKHVKSVEVSSSDILPFHEAVRGLALGFQKLDQAKSVEENKKALKYLSDVRKDLIKLSIESSQLFKDTNTTKMILGMEQQILSEQAKSAAARGDKTEEARLKQQLMQSQEDTISLLEPDDPDFHSQQASKILLEIVPKFLIGRQAFREMNLDRAQRFLDECNQSAQKARLHLEKVNIDNLNTKAVKDYIIGYVLWINGDFVYARILRSAILGDITKKDIKDLEQIESDFLNAAEMFTNAASLMPSLNNPKPEIAQHSENIHNFRSLCERSITPKGIASTATPKVVIYFLGTFLVLLFGLPISGLVASIGSRDLYLIVVVSLFVSVISTFGVEAVRLIPIFDSFAKMFTVNIRKEDADNNKTDSSS